MKVRLQLAQQFLYCGAFSAALALAPNQEWWSRHRHNTLFLNGGPHKAWASLVAHVLYDRQTVLMSRTHTIGTNMQNKSLKNGPNQLILRRELLKWGVGEVTPEGRQLACGQAGTGQGKLMVTLALYLLIHLSRWALRRKTVLSDLLLRLSPENLPSPLFSFSVPGVVTRIHELEMMN